MKRGTPNHPKMKALSRALNVPLPMAVGIMEMLWHFTGQYAPAGDIGKFADSHIEEECGWPDKKRGKLITALLSQRWLEESEQFRLVVHDWPEHCDDAIHMKLARAREYFADGTAPRLVRLPKHEKDALSAFYCAQEAHGVRTESTRRVTSPPPPSPPKPSPPPPCPNTTTEVVVADSDGDNRDVLARQIIAELMPNHPKPGNAPLAVSAAERILAESVSPASTCKGIREAHRYWRKYWHDNPKLFKPMLHRWLQDGDYLAPPTQSSGLDPRLANLLDEAENVQ